MDDRMKDKIDKIKEQLSIGINGARKLLEQHSGDVKKSVESFKKQAEAIVAERVRLSDLPPESIRKLLVKTNYSIENTLFELETGDVHRTRTEILLQRSKDKESTLHKLLYLIEMENKVENKLTRNFWLNLKEVELLSPSQRCLSTIVEWMNMESWEGFDYAICNHDWTEAACGQLRGVFQYNELATVLEEALSISKKHYSVARNASDKPDLEKEYFYYLDNQSDLVDRLYCFVEENIDEFPK